MTEKFVPYQFQFDHLQIDNCCGPVIELDTLDLAIQYAKNYHTQLSKTWIIFKIDTSNKSKGIPIKYIDTNKGSEVDL